MHKEVGLLRNAWLWLLVAGVVIIFYFIFDPMESKFMPQCIFHRLTGLQCMGCGSQRMIHSLLHGDFAGALKANAFVTLSLPFLLFLLWLEMRREKYPVLYARIFTTHTIWGVAFLLALWMLGRNLLHI